MEFLDGQRQEEKIEKFERDRGVKRLLNMMKQKKGQWKNEVISVKILGLGEQDNGV